MSIQLGPIFFCGNVASIPCDILVVEEEWCICEKMSLDRFPLPTFFYFLNEVILYDQIPIYCRGLPSVIIL